MRGAHAVAQLRLSFFDPMNRTYGVELPEYQNTENPKNQKSKVPNTLMRPYIFVTRRAKSGGISLGYTSGYTVAITEEQHFRARPPREQVSG